MNLPAMNLQGQRVYLSGPLEDTEVLAEYEAAAQQLEAWGADVRSPHHWGLGDARPVHPGDAKALGAALDADSEALRNADLIVVLRGGDAVAETMAVTFGLPVVSLIPGQRRRR